MQDDGINLSAQVRYAIVNQHRFMDEWKKRNEKVTAAAKKEHWMLHLDRELKRQANLAAQREYRRRYQPELPQIYVEISRDHLIKIREAWKIDREKAHHDNAKGEN